MLKLRLRMDFAPQAYEEASAVLRSLVGPVRAESGCCATGLLTNVEEELTLTWVEEWRSAEDFEQHLQTPAFRKILAVMELSSVPPVMEIDDVSSRRGFDMVEEILNRVRTGGSTDVES